MQALLPANPLAKDPAFCDVTLVNLSDQHILCETNDLSQTKVFKTCFVYADNSNILRKEFFDYMLRQSIFNTGTPLTFLGHFNAIRYSYEKFGGSLQWNSEKEVFNSYILNAELVDLSYGGCQFTWANKRTRGDYIATKIDRVLVNESWIDQFPASIAMFLPSSISDHSLIVVTVSRKAPSFKKPFKYFDFWAKHEEFLPRVSQDWNQYILGVPMFRVCQKLRSLKPILKSLNKKDFSDISTRVLASKAELDSIQWKLDKDPSNSSFQLLERSLFKMYVDLSAVEESLAHQKSRVQWLGLGDKNSRFFFRSVKSNINRGKILNVEMEGGRVSSKPEEVHDAFIEYFSKLFGTPSQNHCRDSNRIQELIKSRVTSDQAIMMASPVLWPEIVIIVNRESKGRSMKSIITRLSFLCTVYHVWMERNNRIFNKESKPVEVIINSIVLMVRSRMLSVSHIPSGTSDNWFLSQWNLPTSILKPHPCSDGRAAE
ncbi:hypothetical protein ACSBR1_036130 [Camellia fascicularis]